MLANFVITPILIAVFLYVFASAKAAKIVAIIAQTAFTGLAVYLFFQVKQYGAIITSIGNYESVMGIILRADTLSTVFVALTAISFLMAALYSYNENEGKLFWFLLFVWQSLLIGIFLTRDLFNVFVLVEVAAVVVSVLIMYNRDNRSMYDGMFYLMTGIIAMQFYLFGLGYIYRLTGVLDMEVAAEILSGLDRSSLVLPYALIITGVGLKCAILPLFTWLPKAHGSPSAPTVVSALLSGVHIKSGIYLFMRVQPIFQELDASGFFLVIGTITGIAGFALAICQTDIKLLLAYSTVSQIGLIITSLSIGNEYTTTGAMYHAFNHSLFKAALFMGAGILSKVYGTRNITDIRGVFRRFPFLGCVIFLAILGITGAPLFNGSISKYFIMYGTTWYITWLLIFINLGTIIVFTKFSTMLFGRFEQKEVVVSANAKRKGETDFHHRDKTAKLRNYAESIPVNKQVAIAILGLVCFLGGIFGSEFITFLFNVEVSVDAAGYLEKTMIFAVSVVAGILIYRYVVRDNAFLKRFRAIDFGFRGTCAAMGGFFAAVLIVLGFVMN
ncbi:MAG: proton-conducting membrane transporter [Oscillospiraceae bacterium]|nr:proton-conducting membrane transporter [Oscillospiraceae bacterium]